MRTRTLIAIGLTAGLAGTLLSYQPPALAHGSGGWGTMGGYGMGHHMGMMGGYGPGHHMGWGGYGPGHHMESGGGPGLNCPAFGGNRGPGGMGYGYGPGPNCSGQVQGNLNLTIEDVKARMESWLDWRRNPRLKVGEVKEKGANTITAEILTKDNSLVERFVVDRRTGVFRRDDS